MQGPAGRWAGQCESEQASQGVEGDVGEDSRSRGVDLELSRCQITYQVYCQVYFKGMMSNILNRCQRYIDNDEDEDVEG